MSGGEKGSQYQTQDACADTLDVMNKRLSQDLRQRVRRLVYCPVLSVEWKEVAELIGHLSEVAVMESKDITKREGSVWERDELCVRYVIEESKTNLLMRLMVDYKTFLYERLQKEGGTLDDPTGLLIGFENSLGELLRCIFTATESLQTLDMPAFLTHIETVLQSSTVNTTNNYQSQEILVVVYLRLILAQIDRLDEDKILGLVLDKSILSLVLRHCEMYRSKLEDEMVETYIWFLSMLFETEFFQQHRKEFFADAEDKKRICLLEEPAKAMKAAESDADKRRRLRALCDIIIRYK
eukprot:TRINITY_DN1943_c0_g2_i4.p1 TRINITY_DN1943_c0_g2~~TRINITY_DN1943_c0_g2_i4.p1  ORF type:complete len:296 (+),score=56.15 TRINITY_DN1943_c0_g2_i4:48-935(+)